MPFLRGTRFPLMSPEEEKYLLRDEFVTALAAGLVNGTAAEPGPGTRVVITDSGSKLSIIGGELVSAAATGYLDPLFRYGSFARTPGRILLVKTKNPVALTSWVLGFSNTVNPNGTTLENGVYSNALGSIGISLPTGTNINDIGNTTIGTYYSYGLINRAAGNFCFVRGGTEYPNWTLLYIVNTGASATLWPCGLPWANRQLSCGFFRFPTILWLPTPLLSDGFGSTFGTTDGLGHQEGGSGLGAGGGSLIWLDAGTWATAAGVVANTPVVGVELVTDGGFTDTANWDEGVGWTVAGGVATGVAGSASSCIQAAAIAPVPIIGRWYQHTVTFVITAEVMFTKFGSGFSPNQTLSGTYITSARATSTATLGVGKSTAGAGTADNLSVKLLPISTLITNLQLSTTDILAEQIISAYPGTAAKQGTQVGMILNTDRNFQGLANADAAAGQPVIVLKNLTAAVQVGAIEDTITIKHPIAGGTTYTIASVGTLVAGVQTITLDTNLVEAVVADDKVGIDYAYWNGVLLYFDGIGNIKLDEVKAGIYTNRGSTAVTFVADKRLIVRKTGTEVRYFYNEALIASTTAVDAASLAGKFHGLFSTFASNTVTSFCVYAVGSGGEHGILDSFSKD